LITGTATQALTWTKDAGQILASINRAKTKANAPTPLANPAASAGEPCGPILPGEIPARILTGNPSRVWLDEGPVSPEPVPPRAFSRRLRSSRRHH